MRTCKKSLLSPCDSYSYFCVDSELTTDRDLSQQLDCSSESEFLVRVFNLRGI